MKNKRVMMQNSDPGVRHKKKLITAATVVRAITTVAIVAIPVMAITTTIVGYGAYKIFKGLRKKRS